MSFETYILGDQLPVKSFLSSKININESTTSETDSNKDISPLPLSYLSKLPDSSIPDNCIMRMDKFSGKHTSFGLQFKNYCNISPSKAVVSKTVHMKNGLHIKKAIIKDNVDIGNLVTIGENVSIGQNTQIDDFAKIGYDVKIAKNCHIGQGVTIEKGSIVLENITIGSNSMIKSGSLVTRDIPENVIVVGSPARIVVRRTQKLSPCVKVNRMACKIPDWLGNQLKSMDLKHACQLSPDNVPKASVSFIDY